MKKKAAVRLKDYVLEKMGLLSKIENSLSIMQNISGNTGNNN